MSALAPRPARVAATPKPNSLGNNAIDQSASFFDPNNRKAALIREQAALESLDDLLRYILEEGGSVGILDATNSE